eukprot:COSAG05_NODE_166_length_15185_cov_10.343497_14_plen_95_part_00
MTATMATQFRGIGAGGWSNCESACVLQVQPSQMRAPVQFSFASNLFVSNLFCVYRLWWATSIVARLPRRNDHLATMLVAHLHRTHLAAKYAQSR